MPKKERESAPEVVRQIDDFVRFLVSFAGAAGSQLGTTAMGALTYLKGNIDLLLALNTREAAFTTQANQSMIDAIPHLPEFILGGFSDALQRAYLDADRRLFNAKTPEERGQALWDLLVAMASILAPLFEGPLATMRDPTPPSTRRVPEKRPKTLETPHPEGGKRSSGVAPAKTPDLPSPTRRLKIKDVKTISSAEANAPHIARGWSGPYAPLTNVRQFTTVEEIKFVRVHREHNLIGAFLVRAKEIDGMTAQQVQKHLALPKAPTLISEVEVPPGTRMQIGKVAAQPNFNVHSTDAVQYELLDRISSSHFKNTRVLK